MKKILLFLSVFISLISNGQVSTPPSSDYTPINTTGYSWVRGHFRSVHMPTGCGTPTGTPRAFFGGTKIWNGAGAMYLDSCADIMYYWSSNAWNEFGSVLGGNDGNNYPTSLTFNTSTGDLEIARNGLSTLSENLDGRYLLITDTTNKWLTMVYRKTGSDSVFFVKGGNHTFAFIDSTGGASIDTSAMLANYLRTAGDLSPLFTTTESSNNIAFTQSNTTQFTILGRKASGSGAYSFLDADSSLIPGLHSEEYYNTKYFNRFGIEDDAATADRSFDLGTFKFQIDGTPNSTNPGKFYTKGTQHFIQSTETGFSGDASNIGLQPAGRNGTMLNILGSSSFAEMNLIRSRAATDGATLTFVKNYSNDADVIAFAPPGTTVGRISWATPDSSNTMLSMVNFQANVVANHTGWTTMYTTIQGRDSNSTNINRLLTTPEASVIINGAGLTSTVYRLYVATFGAKKGSAYIDDSLAVGNNVRLFGLPSGKQAKQIYADAAGNLYTGDSTGTVPTPTLQQVFNVEGNNAVLTDTNTVEMGVNAFRTRSVAFDLELRVEQQWRSDGIYEIIGINHDNPGDSAKVEVDANDGTAGLYGVHPTVGSGAAIWAGANAVIQARDEPWGGSGHLSQIIVGKDLISFFPHQGLMEIDSLDRALNMTNKHVMVWDSITGSWQRISKDSVGGSSLPSGTQGDILYHDGDNWVVRNIGADNDVLTVVEGLPVWQAPPSGSYSAELGQDDVWGSWVDGNTINGTYNDAGNSFSAEVITQMSLTSDASGIKLVNDETTPTDGKFYGKSGGAKGWFTPPDTHLGNTNLTLTGSRTLTFGGNSFQFAGTGSFSNASTVSLAFDASTLLNITNLPAGDGENLLSVIDGGIDNGKIYQVTIGAGLDLTAGVLTTTGSSGEANTASNLGGGLANWDSKVGVDLRFNSFNATDFDLASNLISIDYINGQKATTSTIGFLTDTDWDTFNGKVGGKGNGASQRIAIWSGTDDITSLAGNELYQSGNSTVLTLTNVPGGGFYFISNSTTENSISNPQNQPLAIYHYTAKTFDFTSTGVFTTYGSTFADGDIRITNSSSVGAFLNVNATGGRSYLVGSTHASATVANSLVFYDNTAAAYRASMNSVGHWFFGGITSPTALIHLAAGTASANTAPLKLTSGTNLTTTEAGAIEYDGTHLYFTATNGGTRYQLDQQGGGSHTIQEEGSNLTARANLNFIGTGFTAADDAGNNATTVTLDADLNTWAGITPGSNVETFLATPSSANLRAALTDENGTGAALFDGATSPAFTTPAITGLATGSGVASGATASTLVARDGNANITANNWLGGYTTTATAAGTTTLTIASTYLQYFTGSTTQNVDLPVVSTLPLGTQYIIVNLSTGNVTIRSSGGNTIVILASSTWANVTSIATTGTDATVWDKTYFGVNIVSGKKVTWNNSITMTGTDGTTMTFPSTTATIARTDAGQTFTGVNSFTSPRITTDISDANGNEIWKLTATASAVNEVTVANGATGNNWTMTASGETNTGITITGKGTKGVSIGNALLEKEVTVSDGAGAVIDASLGNVFKWSAAADRTAGTTTNPTSGQKMVIEFTASGGARTLTLPTATTGDFIFGSDITTLSQTASGKTDIIGCIYNGTRWMVVAYTKGFAFEWLYVLMALFLGAVLTKFEKVIKYKR